MPAPELLLVRHGRSAHRESSWVDVHGLRRSIAAYDAAEIASEPAPPEALVHLVRDARRVIASDLPRAVASAARLAPGGPIERSALLREAPLETPDLPLPALGGLRLPFWAWGTVFGMRWLWASLRKAPPPGVDAAALARAEEAADWLATQANDAGGRVVIITHAMFRLLVSEALARRGWRGPARRPYHEWSAWQWWPPATERSAGIGG